MMKMSLVAGFLCFGLWVPLPAHALSADEVIHKLDIAEFSASDAVTQVRMVLVDKGGKSSERRFKMLEKGADKRLIKFLSPADVKGIGFLDEGKDKMYVFMPAFHKTRRIAGHVKNENFAGTDFTHDDLSSERFSDRLIPKEVKEEKEHYLLHTEPKSKDDMRYSRILIRVRKADFLFDRLEYYDKAGVKVKVFVRKDFKPVGKYVRSFWAEMTDVKSGHKTRMIVESLECDTGLKDRMFTKRQLKRR